jgi:hypothetical protein
VTPINVPSRRVRIDQHAAECFTSRKFASEKRSSSQASGGTELLKKANRKISTFVGQIR